MNKKTIVFLRSNPVNPDSRVEKEANSLAKAGYNVTILAWDRDSNYRVNKEELKLNESTATIYRRGLKASFGEGIKNIIPFIRFQLFLFFWLTNNKKKYDIIHACDFDTCFTARLSTLFTRKKYIFDIFDYLSTDAITFPKKIIKKLEDSLINSAMATIICTEERKKQIKDTKPKKLVVIHNTPQMYHGEEIKKHSKIKVAYVGILQEYRMILEIVNVIKEMKEIELHIGGFGKLEKEIKEIADRNSNIIYYGRLSYNDTLKLENNCDIMTAIYDPKIGNHKFAAPNKFYEALMLGKPLIMVKNTGMSDVVQENNIGICIDFTAESFKNGLIELIDRKNEWQEISSKMKKIYNETYSWNVMEKRLLELYKNI